MVTIIDFKQRENATGEQFFSLIVQGGIELIKSKETGNFYATARKASIPSSFNEGMCKQFIGQKIPGTIERIDCEEYDYQIPGTEETVKLNHTYRYNAEPQNVEEHVFEEETVSV